MEYAIQVLQVIIYSIGELPGLSAMSHSNITVYIQSF